MSGTEIVAGAAERFVILKRLTPPDAGARHACTVPPALHLAFSLTHWHTEFDGVDRAAWLTACAGFGIEVPAT